MRYLFNDLIPMLHPSGNQFGDGGVGSPPWPISCWFSSKTFLWPSQPVLCRVCGADPTVVQCAAGVLRVPSGIPGVAGAKAGWRCPSYPGWNLAPMRMPASHSWSRFTVSGWFMRIPPKLVFSTVCPTGEKLFRKAGRKGEKRRGISPFFQIPSFSCSKDIQKFMVQYNRSQTD